MTTRHEIKAIPTKYNGIEFRSRLEARWAVFFDTLGIKYLYEYEGYQLPSGWYVPDFYLPEVNGGCFVEIKPTHPSDEEIAFCKELCAATGKSTFLQYGHVMPPSIDFDNNEVKNNCAIHYFLEGWFFHDDFKEPVPDIGTFELCCLGICQKCRTIEFRFPNLFHCNCFDDDDVQWLEFDDFCHGEIAPSYKSCKHVSSMNFVNSEKIKSAYEKAQKTKFW